MKIDFRKVGVESANRFTRLGTLYIVALSIIASVAILGQALIQIHLKSQGEDSRVVNVAGKQRMLSQKITKTLLLLLQDGVDRKETVDGLAKSHRLWGISQNGLLAGHDSLGLSGKLSPAVAQLFEDVKPHFENIFQNTDKVINLLKDNSNTPVDSLKPYMNRVLQHEAQFLTGMEKIVFQYDAEAHERVTKLSNLEYFFLIVSLLVLILEFMFIFRPIASHVNETIVKLTDSEKNAKKLSKEIGALYASLEKSYEQISHINEPAETPRLFVKSDKGGNLIFASPLFVNTTQSNGKITSLRICDLFEGIADADDWMDEVIEKTSEGGSFQAQLKVKVSTGREVWADVIINPVFDQNNEVDELIVLCSDITRQKQAEQNMSIKTKAEVEKKINQQKFRSVLILEGQEEERKRLAMDIHDGIGQMLTSLKFQIESIIPEEGSSKKSDKLIEIQQLITQVIKEVRRVTFNLKPTVLGDFGLQAALNVFIREISKLTDIELTYRVEGESDTRLPQKVENNIFRIVQEAINNSIKYSEAKKIEVVLRQSDNEIVITVHDEGLGFDEKLVEARSMNIESGRGFFNMYERTEYINGHLEIRSAPGQGTTVTLTIPVKMEAAVEN